jgi:hypothetical protein
MASLPVRKIKEALRLRESGLTTGEVGGSIGVGRTSVGSYVGRAEWAVLSWPLPDGPTDAESEARLFPAPPPDAATVYARPNRAEVHREPRRPGMTLSLLCSVRQESCHFGLVHAARCSWPAMTPARAPPPWLPCSGRSSQGLDGSPLESRCRRAGAEERPARRHDGRVARRCPRLHAFPQGALGGDQRANPLERVNKEIKRRSDVVGIFPNDAAFIGLGGALMIETNDECAVSRRYMGSESLARITDAQNVRLPAVATLPVRASPKAGAPTPLRSTRPLAQTCGPRRRCGENLGARHAR